MCIYFNGGMSIGVGVSVIDDEQSAICVYFSEGREVEVRESVFHDLRSVFISIRLGGYV